jgi:hypothetical protein
MPRVRQPKRLETLALKKSSEWLCLMGERLIPRVVRESKIDNKVAVERLQTVIEVAHDLFERYVPFYLYKPLSDEVIRGISRMIEKCKDAIEFKANMAKFLAQVNVALSLAQALISVKCQK